ncbi:ThuA domain-containing protein [Ammoniphilus sp. 3BR4]|uniref:ThuA domain-containing protein n=1 Tax=Ammoniphilus sp. 3BR4 TaxID=3158265 RepID=UPI0034657E10
MKKTVRILVWNENRDNKDAQKTEKMKMNYPEGIHKTIAQYLDKEDDFILNTATLDEPEHGLTDEVLAQTDVLIWWGHLAHQGVKDHIIDKVHARILEGMGLIVLHSGHYSKIFKKLMGTSCALKWRVADEKERLWVVDPGHPIVEGIESFIELDREEMYGEFFDIPEPDELIFISWFQGGEVFRSGCTFKRGKGKIFYFRPGHETYPTFHQPQIMKVLSNAVRWAAPVNGPASVFGNVKALEF